MKKTILVSNRLPIKVSIKNGKTKLLTTEGGLATALKSIHQDETSIWIGWPGLAIEKEDPKVLKDEIKNKLNKNRMIPVFLDNTQIEGFYEGFSNEILWPIFHYISTYANFDSEYWKHYVQVNQQFCDKIIQHASPGDTIWIQDYQLLLLPKLLKEAAPNLTIAFFQHIPFPSQELFRLIPWRKELLEGILGADLIGFQTYNDVRHFRSAASRILGAHLEKEKIEYDGSMSTIDFFPIGIDYRSFYDLVRKETNIAHQETIRQHFKNQKIILSIDRLDYSKGILPRLAAFEAFLNQRADYHEKISLYMIVVPSRDRVFQYEDLKNKIDQEVGRINARFGTFDWHPISYFYQSFDHEELAALYAISDVCLVTSMRDGMNLVCKEYIACQTDQPGVLILSELTGASDELVDALVVNPTHIEEMVDSLTLALEMPRAEKLKRMKSLQENVKKSDIFYWSQSFSTKLHEVYDEKIQQKTRLLTCEGKLNLKNDYDKAAKRLLLFDYDGTLVGFQKDPEHAFPDQELLQLLLEISQDQKNTLVIVSGRAKQDLDTWFNNKQINLVAEHGTWIKTIKTNSKWTLRPGISNSWQDELEEILNQFSAKTPGAKTERKSHSVAWHFRKTQPDLGIIRSGELLEQLRDYASIFGLQILEGNKVIEVRESEANKGRAVLSLLEKDEFEFILAVGDDRTDEDMFVALPKHAFSIKIGPGESNAHAYVQNVKDFRNFLRILIS